MPKSLIEEMSDAYTENSKVLYQSELKLKIDRLKSQGADEKRIKKLEEHARNGTRTKSH